jgi:hypothetical protein
MTTQTPVPGTERWECPRHGEHLMFLHVALLKPAPPQSMIQEKILERRYCTQCLVEFLDKHKISEMEPVRPKK